VGFNNSEQQQPFKVRLLQFASIL